MQQLIPLIFGLVTIWFVAAIIYPASIQLTHGFGAYYAAARLLKNGQLSRLVYEPDAFGQQVQAETHGQASDIYNANPPTTSLMLWPLSFFRIETARIIWTGANLLMLWGGVTLLVLAFSPAPNLAQLAALLTVAMLFQPVLANIRLGQAYLLVFTLLAVSVVAWQTHKDFLGGSALAVALLLKTGGWMMLPLLAWQRRWRLLGWVAATGLGVIVLTLSIFPPGMWQRYLELLKGMAASPVRCAPAYQTVPSLVCQLFVFDDVWSPAPLVDRPGLAFGIQIGLALASLIFIFRLNRHRPSAAMMAIITWGVVFAPLGELYHHTVLLIPMIWLAIAWQTRALNDVGRVCLTAAAVITLWPFQPGQAAGGWQVLWAYPGLYGAGLVLFCCFQTRGRKR